MRGAIRFSAPVLLLGRINGTLKVVGANWNRWHSNGAPISGWPVCLYAKFASESLVEWEYGTA
jgi:hypothetical protein